METSGGPNPLRVGPRLGWGLASVYGLFMGAGAFIWTHVRALLGPYLWMLESRVVVGPLFMDAGIDSCGYPYLWMLGSIRVDTRVCVVEPLFAEQ